MNARHVQSPITNAGGGAGTSGGSWRFILAFLVGAVFIYAGALKAWDPVKFASDIQNFHLLSWPLGMRLAFYLPWLEIVCGLALIVGWLRTGAAGILTALLVVFIAATIAARMRGIDLDCGCFGKATKDLPFAWHLAIDFALLAALLGAWFSFHSAARRSR
ncbi:MAG: MauE/DoxX family redox-associated membrane protein [Chthoniobacterales bacterium]